jgi:hypothetical protein
MKDIHYVTSFRNLRISEQITGQVELLPDVNITNDSSVKARFLTPEFANAAGVIETEHLRAEGNIVFGEFETSDIKEMAPDSFLLVILLWIDLLFRNAWLVKDHAMECDAAFLRVETPTGISWTRNYLAMRPSFADGRIGCELAMSIGELNTWAQTSHLVESYLHDINSSSLRFMMEKGYSRSGRAVQFIDAARRVANLAFKIANYCSAFETLFTTDSAELAHKLSERVAFFLGERGYDRLVVFGTIKSAYAIRSKLVHGDTLKAKQIDELSGLSVQCDNYLRMILNALFATESLKEIFDSENDALEEYFAKLIFGLPTADKLK